MYIFTIIIALLSGIFLGILTGITPGIHINLVASVLVAYSFYILKILDPITIAIIIVAMTITHTVFDIIPSALLGIPNTENLSMLLPAHKLTLEGKSKIAIWYGLIGTICGLITTTIFIPLIIKFIPFAYNYIKNYISFILISISFYIIIKNKNKILSLLFFILTGIVGILSFNIKTLDQPLLPLLSGIFGLSALILSIKNKTKLEEQKENIELSICKKDLTRISIFTTLSSLLTNFLPGLTSSHTALLSNKMIKIRNQEEYIIISSAVGASAAIISFVAFYTINKTRSGSVAAINYFINQINLTTLIFIVAISLICLSLATYLAIKISNRIIKIVNKINYKKLSFGIISIILLIVLIITKFEGLLVLITATSIGILAQKFEIERINLTGCLILPVIFYTLNI